MLAIYIYIYIYIYIKQSNKEKGYFLLLNPQYKKKIKDQGLLLLNFILW